MLESKYFLTSSIQKVKNYTVKKSLSLVRSEK